MFDYRVSKQNHFDEACKAFVNRHNIAELAADMGTKPQILRNKFNPEQPHKLTCEEVLLITDLTEDAALLDGMLAQINCLPSVPVNELATLNLSTYALQATAAVGSIAADAVRGGNVTSQRRMSLLDGVNAGIRHLSLIGLIVQGRVQASPALASAVGTIASITTNGMV
ncbi:phage regulatory CII family protein [Ewingella sp. S1.OA.A_B6]